MPLTRPRRVDVHTKCHSERSEESQINSGAGTPTEIDRSRFAKPVLSEIEGLNMTAPFMRRVLVANMSLRRKGRALPIPPPLRLLS